MGSANQDCCSEVKNKEKDQGLERAKEVHQQKTEKQAAEDVPGHVKNINIAYLDSIFLFPAKA